MVRFFPATLRKGCLSYSVTCDDRSSGPAGSGKGRHKRAHSHHKFQNSSGASRRTCRLVQTYPHVYTHGLKKKTNRKCIKYKTKSRRKKRPQAQLHFIGSCRSSQANITRVNVALPLLVASTAGCPHDALAGLPVSAALGLGSNRAQRPHNCFFSCQMLFLLSFSSVSLSAA